MAAWVRASEMPVPLTYSNIYSGIDRLTGATCTGTLHQYKST
jgi:hypothetical protein